MYEWMNKNMSIEYRVTITQNGGKNQVCVEKQPQETGPHPWSTHTYTLQKSLQNLQMKSAQQWYRYIYIYLCALDD